MTLCRVFQIKSATDVRISRVYVIIIGHCPRSILYCFLPIHILLSCSSPQPIHSTSWHRSNTKQASTTMSMSAPARVPLGPLPLSRFVPSLNSFPSPISLPSKRNAPVASSSQEGVKVRKMSRTDEDGHETIRRSRVKEVTPKAKAVLERDDLGVGKSPARRLFVDDCPAGTRYV